MTDIDLTEAVEAAARDLWIRSTHQGVPEGLIEQVHADAAKCWDEGGLSHSEKHYWREIILPVVTAAHRPIARQAWHQGHETPRGYVVDLTLGGEDAHVIPGPPEPNPYEDAEGRP